MTGDRMAVIAECVRRLPRADRELLLVAMFNDALTVICN